MGCGLIRIKPVNQYIEICLESVNTKNIYFFKSWASTLNDRLYGTLTYLNTKSYVADLRYTKAAGHFSVILV